MSKRGLGRGLGALLGDAGPPMSPIRRRPHGAGGRAAKRAANGLHRHTGERDLAEPAPAAQDLRCGGARGAAGVDREFGVLVPIIVRDAAATATN